MPKLVHRSAVDVLLIRTHLFVGEPQILFAVELSSLKTDPVDEAVAKNAGADDDRGMKA